MGKQSLIILFGAWVGIQPFLGVPNRYDSIIFVALGIAIVSLGVLLRREEVARSIRAARRAQSFSQNAHPDTHQSSVEHTTKTSHDTEEA